MSINASRSDDIGIIRTIHYRVRRSDLASTIYRCLGWELRKPDVMASARVLWLAERVVMPAMPTSLGVLQVVKHPEGAVLGSTLTATAECTKRCGRYWEWDVEIKDDLGNEIATCTLGFVSVEVKDYTERRVAPKLAARPARVVWWLRFLGTLSFIAVTALPVQVAYAWRSWMSTLAVGATLIVGWWLTRRGLALWVSDWFTIRPEPSQDRSAAWSFPLPRPEWSPTKCTLTPLAADREKAGDQKGD